MKAQQKWADGGFKPHLKPKPRAIPQISIEGDGGKELCPSVLELADSVPEIMAYASTQQLSIVLICVRGSNVILGKVVISVLGLVVIPIHSENSIVS